MRHKKTMSLHTALSTLGLGAAFAFSFAPGLAHAQAYERIAPKQPAQTATPKAQAPHAPAHALKGKEAHQVLLKKLKGLVFVSSPEAVVKNGIDPATLGPEHMRMDGLKLLNDPGFKKQITHLLGRRLTRGGLTHITLVTTRWYRTHGQPFLYVSVPEQNITGGVVQVVVLQYKVGKVSVAGNTHFKSAKLISESGLKPGNTLSLAGVQAGLNQLNSNPFRTVNTVFSPGTALGTSDVTLETHELKRPWRVYTSFDNNGIPGLGRGEWSVGANWGNAFGLDQQLSYQYTRADSGNYSAHALSWQAPIGAHNKVVAYGSYARQTPDLGATFGQLGHSGQVSGRFVHILPGLGNWFSHDVQVGYDFKTSNSNLEFGGSKVFSSQVQVNQFPIIYDAAINDPWGQTTFQNQFVYSPGNLTAKNDNTAFSAAVNGAQANYVYDHVAATRTTFLPAGMTWVVRAAAQAANHNLLYSEQLAAGGPNSVRGYNTDQTTGSKGLLISNELRAPMLALPPLTDQMPYVTATVQPGVFIDYGHVAQIDGTGGTDSATLASTGLTMHGTLAHNISLQFDLGLQLRTAPGDSGHGAFGNFAVVVSY